MVKHTDFAALFSLSWVGYLGMGARTRMTRMGRIGIGKSKALILGKSLASRKANPLHPSHPCSTVGGRRGLYEGWRQAWRALLVV